MLWNPVGHQPVLHAPAIHGVNMDTEGEAAVRSRVIREVGVGLVIPDMIEREMNWNNRNVDMSALQDIRSILEEHTPIVNMASFTSNDSYDAPVAFPNVLAFSSLSVHCRFVVSRIKMPSSSQGLCFWILGKLHERTANRSRRGNSWVSWGSAVCLVGPLPVHGSVGKHFLIEAFSLFQKYRPLFGQSSEIKDLLFDLV